MNERANVSLGATSVGPGAKVTPGISSPSVCPAGRRFVTVIVTVSPSFTISGTPGSVAVPCTSAQVVLACVGFSTNPQIGTWTEPVRLALPVTAQRLIATGAAGATAPPPTKQ